MKQDVPWSFKDLEASPTMERLMERKEGQALVVASAGNTARAFAQAASAAGLPLVLVVPTSGESRLWTTVPPSESICVVSVKGDYTEAIDLAARLAGEAGFVGEGGARNVARMDGIGVIILEHRLRRRSPPSACTSKLAGS